MATEHPSIGDDLAAWMAEQHLFFVASATDAGPVNLSPKGYDTFRVLGPNEVCYLDLTGSGIETTAHLQVDGRMTFLFCAFEGPPRIVRLHGRGTVHRSGDEFFDDTVSSFPDRPGIRSIIRCDVDRVFTSCGYSIPFYDYVGERTLLDDNMGARGDEGVEKYWAKKNHTSIGGLPGI